MRVIIALCLFATYVAVQASDVVVLTDSNFDTSVKKGDWLLEFYAPWCGHCKSLAPTYEEVATKLKGTTNVGKVDCTENRATCQRFGVQGYPTIKFYKQSEGKVFDYRSDRTVDSFVFFTEGAYSDASSKDFPAPAEAAPAEVVEEHTGPSDVVVLTDSNFDSLTSSGNWLIEFFAPWCGHCKKLIPTYEKLATKLKGTVNIAKVDCTVEKGLARRFGIQGYPTIKYLVANTLYDYKGDRSIDHFTKFTSEDYKTAQSAPFPSVPSELDNLVEDLGLGFKQLESILVKRFWIVIAAVFMLGLFIGTFIIGGAPALPPAAVAQQQVKTAARKQD